MPYAGQFTVPWIYWLQSCKTCNNHRNMCAKAHFKKSSSSQRTTKFLSRIWITIFKHIIEPSKDFCYCFWNPHLFVFPRSNKRALQHSHKFSPIPVRDIHTKPSCFFMPQLLRTQKATNKMTVTASSAERTPLGVSTQEPLCSPASQVKGNVTLHPSNLIFSLVYTLIKSFSYFR